MTVVASAAVELTPELSRDFGQKLSRDMNGKLRSADGKFVSQGGKSGKSFGVGFGRGVAKIGGGIALAGIIKHSSQLEQRYSKTMATLQASSKASGGEIKQLDGLAMKLGSDTAFSANEAAEAMLELSKAGISTKSIMTGAAQGTLLLATAGGTNLTTAATIASNAMNTFNLRGRDMGKIAAALAGGANASSASVESLGQALQQVGPGARNAGLSLQQTVGVLSAFDAAGIKGSDAGTSLKTMLTRLVPSTDKARTAMSKLDLDFTKADGSFVSITNVAEQLRKKLGPLSEEQRTQALQTIFGSDATRAATVLMNQGAKGIGKYIGATKDQTAAQKMADAAMSGTSGAMERLRGATETAQLAIGKALAPTITNVANWLSTKAVPAVSKFITEMRTGEGAGGDLANTLGNLVDTGQAVVGFINGLPGPVKRFGAEALIAAVAVNKLSNAVAFTKFTTFLTGLRAADTAAAGTATRLTKLGGAARFAGGVGGLALITDSTTRAAGGMSTLEAAAGGALTGAALGAFAGPPGAAIGAAIGGLAGAALGLSRNTGSAGGAARASLPSWEAYAATLDQVTGKITGLTREEAANRLSKAGLLSTARSLGVSDRQAVTAVTQQGAARRNLNAQLVGSIGNTKKAIELQTFMSKTGSLERREQAKGNLEQAKARLASLQALQKELGAVDKASAKWQHRTAITRQFSSAINSLPKKVQTELRQKGLEKSRAAIVDLARRYDLTPRNIRTLIRENGGKPTKAMVESIIRSAQKLDKQHPNPKVTVRDFATSALRGINALMNALDGKTSNTYVRVNRSQVTHNDASTRDGGRRALGGSVRRNSLYRVNERGEEFFQPGVNGRIIPNHKLEANAERASSVGSGASIFHVYDSNDHLIGTMSGVADERYYANQELGR